MSLKTFAIRARIAVALVLVIAVSSAFAAEKPKPQPIVPAAFAKLPLTFEPNQGQTSRSVKYLSRGAGYTLFLTGPEAFIALEGKDRRDVIKLALRGAKIHRFEGLEIAPGTTSYFLGNDPDKWIAGVSNYKRVRFASVYKGVDLVYYGNNGLLEYDFVVAPGAEFGSIAFEVTGTSGVSLDEQGNLILKLSQGNVQLQKPQVYQVKDGNRLSIPGNYELSGNIVRFQIGPYDHTHELIIDPVLNYSSYLGGVGGSSAVALRVDASGNAYVTGSAGDLSFPPTATNACTSSCNNGANGIYVAKINASGDAISYLAVVGGTGTDTPTSIAVDGTGQAHVGGYTTSTNFPSSAGAFQTSNQGGQDGFFFKLNASGTALLYSTYVGTAGPDAIFAIAANTTNVWVGGSSNTAMTVPAAVSAQSFRSTPVGGLDGFVSKFKTAGTGTNDILWHNYLGGDAADNVSAISVPAADRVFATGVAGLHTTTAFPTTTGVFQAAHGANDDAFVTRLDTASVTQAAATLTQVRCRDDANSRNVRITTTAHSFVVGERIWISGVTAAATGEDPNGLHTITGVSATTFDYIDAADCNNNNDGTNFTLGGSAAVTGAYIYSTFAGGNGVDRGFAIAADANNNAYVTGETSSTDGFDAANTIQATGNGTAAQMAFILSLAGDGTDNYSAFIGEAGKSTVGRAITIDPACGATCRPTLAGSTTATGRFNINALQSTLGGAQDGFVAQVNSAGNGLRYATLVGGTGTDSINDIALVSGSQTVYFAGTTDSADLPVTASAYQTKGRGASNAFVAKFSANNNTTAGLTLGTVDSVDPVANDGTHIFPTVYTFTVGATAAATNPVFNMVIPDNGTGSDLLTVNTATTAGGTCTTRAGSTTTGPGGVTCEMANIAGGGSATVVVNATPTSAVTIGTPINVASGVQSAEPGAAATDSETTNVAEVIDPTVTTSSNSNVTGGAQYKDTVDTSITYTINIFNPSTNPTDAGVQLQAVFTYPANFNFVSADAGCTNNTPSAGKVTCIVTGIGAGATKVFNVTGNFSTVAAPATLLGHVDLAYAGTSSTQIFVTSTNNQNIATNVAYLGPTADLQVTTPLTVTGGPTAHIGNSISFQAFFQNKAGSDPTTATTLTFTFDQAFLATGLPAGCTQAGGAGTAVTCTLGGLAAGATGNRTISGAAPLSSGAGSATMNVTATITATGATVVATGDDAGVASVNIIRDVALSVSNFTANPNTSIHQTQTITYSVDVANGGPDPATNIITIFTLTGNYASFTPISGGCVATNTTTVTCTNAGPLASGASQTGISFSIKPDPALVPTSSPSGTIAASVAVSTTAANLNTGATPSAGPINTTVERRTDINITTFTNSPNPIGQTANVTYTATVQNDGANDGKNIRIHFTLPLNYVINAGGTSASCNVNVTTTGRDCDITTLQPGAGNAVTLNVSFAPAAGTVPTTAANATINASVNVDAVRVAVGNVDGATGTKTRGPVGTTVERRANTALTSFSGPATSPDGVNITYNAGVNNAGPDTAEGVKLDITFGPAAAAGFSFVSSTAPGGCAITSPTVLTCTVGTLANGASSAFNVIVRPPVGFLGGTASKNLTADTLVSGNYVDGTPANDSQPQVSTSVQASADLAISMVANQDPTNLSQGEVYTITAQSQPGSASVASNVRVRMTMASNSGRTFTATGTFSFSPNWSCQAVPPNVPGGSTLTCTYALPLNPGDVTPPLFVFGDVFLPSNQQNGNITSTAVIDTFPASVVETNAADNTSAPVVLVQRLADLGLAPINAQPFSGATAGTFNGVYQQGVHDHLKYFISVHNFGPDQAVAVSVQAPAPAGSTLYGPNPTPFTYTDSVGSGNCSLTAGNFICSGLTIDSGADANIVLDMVPAQIATQSGTLNTNWSANSTVIIDSNGSGGSNNQASSVSIERHGDFQVAISTPAGPIVTGFTGNTITYNVTVTGDPSLNLTNVQVQDVLPTNLTFSSTVPGPGVSCGNVVNTVTCTIATLNAGATASFQVIAIPSVPNANSQITVTNTVSGSTSSIFDDNPGNNTNITSGGTVLLGDTDLQVSITSAPVGGTAPGANAGEVIAGQDLQYTITVSNVGPHQSGTLRVDHVIPAGTTLVSVNSLALGCSAMPCVNVGGLGAGASAQIAVVIHIPASAVPTDPTTLNYSVLATNFGATTVGANTSDPNNANNDVTVGTTARQTSDMTLTAGVAPALVQQAQPGTFTITVTNSTALNNASGVVVTIPIAAAPLTNSASATASASPGGACAPSGLGTAAAQLTCNIGTLAPGASSTITMSVTPTLSGQVQITPAVTVTNVDPVNGNNSATSTLLVGNTPPGSNISVNPANSTTGVANPNIVVTFPTVSNPGGNTSADPTAFVPAPPSGYKNPVVSFDLATTALHSGNPTTVCFNVSGVFTKPDRTRVFAYVAGNPVDITFVGVGAPFTMGAAGGTVCGNINIIGAFNATPVTFVVTEPLNSVPTADGGGTQSQGTGKGLTGTGITLNAAGSTDDVNPCTVGANANATCNDLSNALLTWNGQFTDANQKTVQCTPATYPACLQLNASVPFGSQTITLTITDAYGATSAPFTVPINLAGGAATGVSNVTLNAGQSATFGLSYAAGSSAVTLVATITPATNTITCSVNPSTVPAGVTNNSVALLCSTQGPVFAKNERVLPNDSGSPMLASAVGITALPLVGILLLPTRRRRNRKMKVLAILGLILLMTLFMSACGGGGGSSFGGSTKLQSSGTPKGTYTVMVTGKDSSGNTVGSAIGPFTIVVQ